MSICGQPGQSGEGFSLFFVYNFYYLRKSVLLRSFGAISAFVKLTDGPNSLCTALHCIVNGHCCKIASLCVCLGIALDRRKCLPVSQSSREKRGKW